MINFSKYQGAGNDFVVLDNRTNEFTNIEPQKIAQLCDRRFGIGADGILLLSSDDKELFRMEYFNSDGSRADFCGNGARCICAFALEKNIVEKNRVFIFVADDGEHNAICRNNWVDLQMIDIQSVALIDDGYFLNTGVPHFVKFVPNVDDIDILKLAPPVRSSEKFGPNGTNVDFVSIIDEKRIKIRTFERGVEGETLACGTGITAAAIATSFKNNGQRYQIEAKGGNLTVQFEKIGNIFRNVMLGGEARKVFEGTIDL